jgi:hypothetical protein
VFPELPVFLYGQGLPFRWADTGRFYVVHGVAGKQSIYDGKFQNARQDFADMPDARGGEGYFAYPALNVGAVYLV